MANLNSIKKLITFLTDLNVETNLKLQYNPSPHITEIYQFCPLDSFSSLLNDEYKFGLVNGYKINTICILPNGKTCVLLGIHIFSERSPRIQDFQNIDYTKSECTHVYSTLFSSKYFIKIAIKSGENNPPERYFSDTLIKCYKINGIEMVPLHLPEQDYFFQTKPLSEKINKLLKILHIIDKEGGNTTAWFDLNAKCLSGGNENNFWGNPNYPPLGNILPFFKLLSDFKLIGDGIDSQVFKHNTRNFVLKVGNMNVLSEFRIYERLSKYKLDFIGDVYCGGVLKFYSPLIDIINDYMNCAFLCMKYIDAAIFTDKRIMDSFKGTIEKNLKELTKIGIIDNDRFERNILVTKQADDYKLWFIDWSRAIDMYDPNISNEVKRNIIGSIIDLYGENFAKSLPYTEQYFKNKRKRLS